MVRGKPYLQNPPRPNERYDIVINDFSGGLNNRTDVIDASESPYVVNMRYDETKGFVKRNGTEFFDSTDLPDPILYIDEYRPYTEPDQLIRATKNGIFLGSERIKNITGQISGLNFNGLYFFADGEKLHAFGSFPQEQVEPFIRIIGTPTPGNHLFTVENPPADYVPLDTTYTVGVTVYSYTSNQVWYEPCQNEILDTYKGANVVPTGLQFLTDLNGRMYASGAKDSDDTVYITDIQNPYYFPVYLPLQLPPNSDAVRGLATFDNSVVVSREYDMYAIRGNSNRLDTGDNLYELFKLNTHTGFANNESHDVAHNYLFYVGADGQCYALMNVTSGENLSTTILNKQVDFLKQPFYKFDSTNKVPLTKQDVVKARTYFFQNNWHVAVGDQIALYNYETQAWSLYNGLNASAFYHKDYKLIIGRNDGRTTVFTDQYLDLGEPFLATWWSKRLDLGDPLTFKHFRDFFISLYPHVDHASDVRITVLVDGKQVNVIDIARSVIARYGKAVWGDMYVTVDSVVQIPFYVNLRGRFIQFKVSNAWNVAKEVFEFGDLTTVVPRTFNETLAKVTSENKYYLFTDGDVSWVEKKEEDLNQPLKFIQLAGDYELRRRRW